MKKEWAGLAGLGVLVLALVIWGIFQFSSGAVFRQISATEAHTLIRTHKNDPDFIVLDVRTPEEFAQGHLPGKTPMNLDFYAPDFREQLTRLDRKKTYLVYCLTGSRSEETVQIMKELGFHRIYDLKGGIVAWRSAGLPLKH
ncbi:MAG: rhodanese-like domain-containing protein [Candidatus Bipolaricaulota bacterium]|nr:rhodanese-like domain-containing protein [Candidatus Bipolaricaulota bacterium]MDW8031237.1 rhodanese-like domain-containing protein [Candidatus Bipolaricaulota bacterium]